MNPSIEAAQMDPAIPEVVEVVELVAEKTPEASASERALITEFNELVKTPQFLRDAFEQMQEDRAYVAEELIGSKDQDTVIVNQVLKNQQTVVANLGLDDPKASCKVLPQAGGLVDPSMTAMSETMELFLNRMITQTRLPELMEGAAQDAQTNGIAWLKVSVQEDFLKDPVGQNRFNDQQENVAEYLRLQEAKAAGDFNDDSADAQKLKDLDHTLKVWMADRIIAQPPMIPQTVMDPMTGMPTEQMVPDPTDPRTVRKTAIIDGEELDLLGCPELERYLGFSVDQLLPEDVRWDWSIKRPEELRRGAWMAYRVYLSKEDIAAKFALEQDEYKSITVYTTDGKKTERRWGILGPDERTDIEAQQINDRCAVWTLEHRVMGRRYVWVDGVSRFLASEVFQAVGSNPFSLFPVYFNRVSGRALPLSDVRLQRDLQNEYNLLRTHDRQGRRASYPWVALAAGAADQADIDAIEGRAPFQAVMLKKADDVNKYMKEMNGAPYNQGLYDTSKVVADMQMVANVPLTGMGVQGEGKVATDLTLANQGMQKANSRRQAQLNRTFSDLLEWMGQVAVKVFPADNIKAMCGMQSVWLALSAEQLSVNFQIEIQGAVSGPPDFAGKMQFWTAFPDIIMKLQSVPGINVGNVMAKVMALGGISEDIRNFWNPMMAQPGGMPNAPAPGGDPNAQGLRGQEGGAPPMQGVPSPEKLPNNPGNRLGQ
jgi:hypothetical protein